MAEPRIIISHDFDYEKLVRALLTDDDIGAMLRLHFEMERCLDFMIADRFSSPKSLNAKYFSQKVGCLHAIGFLNSRLQAFKFVNRVRNMMAHEGRECIKIQEADELVSIVSRLMPHPLGEFKLRIPKVKKIDEMQISELEPKDRFVIAGFAAAVDASALPKIFTQDLVESYPDKL